ncbi:unnamed protein product [Victoria cruziana]
MGKQHDGCGIDHGTISYARLVPGRPF